MDHHFCISADQKLIVRRVRGIVGQLSVLRLLMSGYPWLKFNQVQYCAVNQHGDVSERPLNPEVFEGDLP